MSQESKPWMGLSKNLGNFIGRVESVAYFDLPSGEGQGAFITLRTRFRQQQANGQWADVEQVVPLYVMNSNKVESTIKKYVSEGRQIEVDSHYATWGNNNEDHGFMVTNIQLGDSPYQPKEGKSSGPNLPPG